VKPLEPAFPSDNAIRLATRALAQQFGAARRLRRPLYVTYTTLLLFAPVEIFGLELGDASIKNALGESLFVEIPYRLADNEQLTPACVKLVPARSRDALPTYTRAARITITSTTIEIFDDERVLEPLIGLTIDVDCSTALHFVRTYELLVDLPDQAPTISSDRVEFAATPSVPHSVVASGTTAIAAADDQVESAPVARAVRAHGSPRARGRAGGNVTQGQTYRVVRGDTLSGIAARVADRPATIRETSEAIFAANASAFTHGNPDLIEEGRSIVIPILTGATAAALATAPAPDTTATLPAPAGGSEPPIVAQVPTFEPIAVPPVAAQPSPAEESTNIVALDATEPLPADATSDAVPVAEPIVAPPVAEPIVSATPIELAPGAESQTTPQRSPWLSGFLALGVGIVLSAPLAFGRLRRRLQPVPKTRDDVQQRRAGRLAPLAPIEVVESRTGETGAYERPAPRRSAAVATGGETVEDDAATVRMPDAHAINAREPSPEPDVNRSLRAMDDEQMTMTIPQLDMLRQDYEAERTLTQQLSPELRDAVADLQATKAREASKSRSLLESDDTEPWADSTAVRIRK
jgi:hypothetical protein